MAYTSLFICFCLVSVFIRQSSFGVVSSTFKIYPATDALVYVCEIFMASTIGQYCFIGLQHVLPQHLVSRMVGKLASSQNVLLKNALISYFINTYGIDMSLALEESPTAYPSFNAFFTRALKPYVRPIDNNPLSIVSPADGCISQLGQIDAGDIFQAKGQSFDLKQLIGNDQLAKPFVNGSFATVYLSPKDYHRVHMPFSGTLTHTIYIPGELFSVNNTTAQHVSGLFARNERMVCLFDTPNGRMAVVLVGALIVAGIETVATGKIKPTANIIHATHQLSLNKGDELGRFYLGSTAIVLFEPNTICWHNALTAGSAVTMGHAIAQLA